MDILLTGFEPFGSEARNPTAELIASLQEMPLPEFALTTAVLPVDTETAPPRLQALLEAHHPEVVLLTGLAAARSKLSLERVALNLLDFEIPDNAGRQIREQPIVPQAPAAYFSTLALHPLCDNLNAAGLPAEISNTAGTYLCNQVFYRALHWAAEQPTRPAVGFLHVPRLAESRDDAPGLSLRQLREGVRVILENITGGRQ